MKAQFKFLSGARAGDVEAFRKAYIGLGRHPLSDVRFDAERDLDVSSRHAAIVRKPEGFVLQDLSSRNGTFVNGTRITGDTPLKDGDVIGFGANGPAIEFAVIEAEHDLPPTTAAEALAERASAPREVYQAAPALRPTPLGGGRPSTGVRIAVEVARQTAQLRRTTDKMFITLRAALRALARGKVMSAHDAHAALIQAQGLHLCGLLDRRNIAGVMWLTVEQMAFIYDDLLTNHGQLATAKEKELLEYFKQMKLLQPLVWKASVSDAELKNFFLNLQRAGDLLAPLASAVQQAGATQLKQSPRKY